MSENEKKVGGSGANSSAAGKWLLGIAGFLGALLLSSCQTTDSGEDFQTTLARFVVEAEHEGALVRLPVSGVEIAVSPKAVLTEYDFVDVEVAAVDMGSCLQFTLTPRAARSFHQISAMNQGRRLVLMVNGVPMGARRIERPISDGVVYIFAEMPDAELPALAKRLKGTSIEIQRKISG